MGVKEMAEFECRCVRPRLLQRAVFESDGGMCWPLMIIRTDNPFYPVAVRAEGERSGSREKIKLASSHFTTKTARKMGEALIRMADEAEAER